MYKTGKSKKMGKEVSGVALESDRVDGAQRDKLPL